MGAPSTSAAELGSTPVRLYSDTRRARSAAAYLGGGVTQAGCEPVAVSKYSNSRVVHGFITSRTKLDLTEHFGVVIVTLPHAPVDPVRGGRHITPGVVEITI